MTDQPLIFREISALRRAVAQWRAAGETIALIPTMGALHAGHIRCSKPRAPMRAGRSCRFSSTRLNSLPTRIFRAYPRTFDADLAKLAEAGCDGCFAPHAGNVSAGLFDEDHSRRPGAGGAGGQVPARPFRRRRAGGRQTAQSGAGRLRLFRREGFPAARRHPPHGRRSRHRDAKSSAFPPCASPTASRCPRATSI